LINQQLYEKFSHDCAHDAESRFSVQKIVPQYEAFYTQTLAKFS